MEVIKLSQEWQIGSQLGQGGFGRVYVARSAGGVQAVIKLIPKAPGADRELLFEELSGVQNIIPILDRGEWADFWVLAMSRAEKSLRDHISEHEGRLQVNDAVSVLIDIGEALVAIEGRVVHRDLKPENVLLFGGHWCLADFGIARYAEATTAPDTRKYAMTPPYAAPEQWRAERATSATDVYATGLIAYEMLGGRRPFTGPEKHDYRRQHLEDTPAPIQGIPQPLQTLISECLYKAPQARPRPQNLLARLRATMSPTPESAQRLQHAYGLEVEKQAEVSRQQSMARSEAERRAGLYQVAEQALAHIAQLLHSQVVASAPGSAPSDARLWPCTLNSAQLSIDPARSAEIQDVRPHYHTQFEVIAYSSITLCIPPDPWEYEGRSHSLWYCDAQEPGVFRWYETAFMINPFIPRRERLNPFALNPGEQAYGALSPAMTEYQVAWPFIPIDQGKENEFIERWIAWFAAAAEGKLCHPSHMPEKDPRGSWRQSPEA
ncbi:MAG: serine/threonine-protein kinase [Dehalococcoidia bacterium]